ncbi:DNA polymerase II large subunit [archaeon]|nr:DNA polymerase II large subunit [archaeon]
MENNIATSKEMKEYFKYIEKYLESSYLLANKARKRGFDPSLEVEIPVASNMAERVEKLIGILAPEIVGNGIPERIIELEKVYNKLDWRVAFTISLEVAEEKFCKFENKQKAIETGLRIGFAYVTTGVVASPVEGFTKLTLPKRKSDGKEYFCLYFSGPVRSAGGTAASVFVLLSDYVRKKLGYAKYDPTEKESKRAVTELRDYHERVTNLQYFPSDMETEFMAAHMPIQISGDPTEKMDVSNYKDLDRIETNRIRGGFCLVMGECLAQKAKKYAAKLTEWGSDFEMEDWDFIQDFVKLQKKIKAGKQSKKESDEKITADYTFIKDMVAGRPVLTYPNEKGGLRLRYGRSRNTGLSCAAIHPATMKLLNGYIGVGTQLKMERPGKGTALSVTDYIEGPIAKLKNGEVVFVETEEIADNIKDDVQEILFLGDILVNYGDFFDRAHSLVPVGYCEEWWIKELKNKEKDNTKISELTKIELPLINKLFMDPIKTKITPLQAQNISIKLNIPFHPKFTYHWEDISPKEFLFLIEWLTRSVIKRNEDKIILPISNNDQEVTEKRILEKLGVPHKYVTKEHIILEGNWAKAFLINLGLETNEDNLKKLVGKVSESKSILTILNKVSSVKLRNKSGTIIGARMGRPEKAKIRKLTGSPHSLFPVGEEGGRLKSFESALEKNQITENFPIRKCTHCNNDTVYNLCENCGKETEKLFYCRECNSEYTADYCKIHKIELKSFKRKSIDISKYYFSTKKKLKLTQMPKLIKGIKETTNEEHIPENLTKGVLRSIHNLFVNKDGTIRYDMTELPLTHFNAEEIGTSIEKLKELGYSLDIYGNEIVNDSQIIELKPQDVVLASCDKAMEGGADHILYRVANFVDDLLNKFYGIDKFYNLKSKKDLVGHLILSLAPHTSAGIIGRIIGFSKTQGCYAHPLWHSAQRRDCDGDENGIMLLMDGLLNFSKHFLPNRRGSTQDAPLVLTSKLIPTEVDDMVFNMDVVSEYPLEFYDACMEYKMPWEVPIERLNDRLETEKQFEKYWYTHETSSINQGIVHSAYKSLPSMQEKVLGQMDIAEKVRAVYEADVARLIIEKHFIRDIKGNLRKFSMQQFRCVGCNTKYRRPPLKGNCLKCGGKIILTISEGSVVKYLKPSLDLANKYDIPEYLKQTLQITKDRIESVFGKELERQEGLTNWFTQNKK